MANIQLRSRYEPAKDDPPEQLRWPKDPPIKAASFATKHEKGLALGAREQATEIVLTGMIERLGERMIGTMTAETTRDELSLMFYLVDLKRRVGNGDEEKQQLAEVIVNSYANLGHQGIEAALKVSIDQVGGVIEQPLEPVEDKRPWWQRLFGGI